MGILKALDPTGIISGGMSLIGNLVGINKTNKTNMKIAQMTNEFNERMLDKQINYNKEAYQQQLADSWDMIHYNDTSNQMQRIRDAGLNPYLMMDGGSGVSSSSGTTPSMQGINPPSGASYTADYRGIGSAFAEALNLATDYDLKQQNIKQLQIENKYKSQEILANLENLRAKTNNEKLKYKIDAMLAPLEAELKRSSTSESMSRRAVLQMNARGQALDNMMKEETLKTLPEQLKLDVAKRVAELEMLKINKRITDKQLEHEIHKISGTVLDNNQKMMNQNEQADTYNNRYNKIVAEVCNLMASFRLFDKTGNPIFDPMVTLFNTSASMLNMYDSRNSYPQYK